MRGIGRRIWALARNEAVQAVFVLLVEIWIFLGTPISRYADVYYSSADLTQSQSLTRLVPGHQPGNQLQSDAVTQMQPWLMFNREELSEGRMALWNPWNGAGCPHFANYQSAVFSPFSVPFYVLDFKLALLVSAAMKLFALGFFTWLFLRAIELRHVAAIIGATAFTFAGHNALLLYFPHVGAMVALPAGMYFLEIAFRRMESAAELGSPASRLGPLLGFGATVLVGLLAGNPEPFYFAMLLCVGYALFRIVPARRYECAPREILTLLVQLALTGAIAVGLAAFQILPFFEYLDASRVLQQRSLRQTPLEWVYWPLTLFPDVLGNPASPYKLSDNVPPPNYELVNMAYVGGVAVFLAVLSARFLNVGRYVTFFVVAAVLWLFYAYDLFGASDLFALIPTVDMAPMNRSQGLWNFLVACLAALAVDRLLRRHPVREFPDAIGVLVLGAATLVACLIGADRLIETFATYDSPNHGRFLAYVPAHLHWMTWLFAGGIALIVFLFLSNSRVGRGIAASGLCAIVFLQNGHLLRDYNPVAENAYFFPRTPAIAELQAHVGHDRLAILGEDMIPPDSNIPYHLQLIQNYDGMWVRDFDFLYRDHFGDTNNWRPIVKGTKRSLKIFGVQWVLAKWGWNFLDNGLAEFGKGGGQKPIRLEILPDREVTQTFRARDEGLRAVMVQLATFPKQRACSLHFKLEDLDGGRVISEQTLTSAEVQSTVYSKRHVVWPGEYRLEPQGRPVVFRFEPQRPSFGRRYKLTLACPEGRGGDTICAFSMPLLAYGEGESHHGKRKLAGEILFDWTYDGDEVYERVAEFEDYVLFRYKDAVPKYSLVGGAVIAETDAEALELLRAPSFDPRQIVVLQTDGTSAPGAETAFGPRDNSKRRVVQFDGGEHRDWCYLIAEDGRSLVHIDDEVTFLANKFRWDQIEHLPAAERANFTLVDDEDREAKRRAGLRLVNPPAPGAAPVEVLEETPTRVRLRLQRREPGYLVVAQAHFPGWKATIGGEPTPVLRANYAFDAIEVPPGDSEVELAYRPDSLRHGLWIGGASALVGLIGLGIAWRRRPLPA